MSFSIHFHKSDNRINDQIVSFLKEWNSSNEYVEVQTSGSTGKPKTIKLKKEHMRISAGKTNAYFGLSAASKALLCLSLNTIAGKMMLVRAICGNYSIVISPPSNRPLQNITEKIDFVALVPLQLKNSLDQDVKKLSSIDHILVGGGVLSSEVKKLISLNNLLVHHSFGMTETISHVAFQKIGINQSETYKAIPGVHFAQQDDQLCIHYPEIELTGLLTNDIVTLIDDQNFIWHGRKDFIVNSGGIKFQVEELEKKYAEIIDVPFFIFGEEDPVLGEKIVLCVESDKPIQLNKDKMKDFLPAYGTAKKVYYFPTFKYTVSGKINRIETLSTLNERTQSEIL